MGLAGTNMGCSTIIHHGGDIDNYSKYLAYRLGSVLVEASISEGAPIECGLSAHNGSMSLVWTVFLVDSLHWARSQCSHSFFKQLAISFSFPVHGYETLSFSFQKQHPETGLVQPPGCL